MESQIRGEHVYPLVILADVHMRTRFGGRQRPSFTIKKWINLGGDDKVLPTPSSGPALVEHVEKELEEAKKPAETPTKKPAKGARVVKELTLEEIIDDGLPDELK